MLFQLNWSSSQLILFICSTAYKYIAKDVAKQNEDAALRGKQSKMFSYAGSKNVENSLRRAFNFHQSAWISARWVVIVLFLKKHVTFPLIPDK